MKALTSSMPVSTFLETIIILQVFHPLDLSLFCLYFLMEFQLNIDLDFSLNMFMSTFIHSAHLLIGGPLGMVFEHLQDIFGPKDSASCFSQLFLVRSYIIAPRCIFENITRAFGVVKLLILAKPSSGIRPIAINKVFY
jgi:hypothetical protein